MRIRVLRLTSLALVVLAAAACGAAEPSPATPRAPAVTAEAAGATAIANLDAATTTPTIASTTLASAQALGVPPAGQDGGMAADAPIWVVTLSGSFETPCETPAPSSGPCPTPVTSARAYVDATTGAFMEGSWPAEGLEAGS